MNLSVSGGSAMPANRIVLIMIAVLTLLLTFKYFPGFEQSHPYSGNAFQVIHPDAFEGDLYKAPGKSILERPFQLSLLYLLVKLGGEIWLDDRFVVIFYIGLVFAGLLGIDRIAQLLGITRPVERLLILMLFLKDHAILGNNVLLAHHPDINHFALAIPIIVWLTYAALARKGLVVVLLLCCLLAAVSVRNAVFPSLFALILVAWHGGRIEKIAVTGIFAAGFVIAYIGLFHLYPMPGELRLTMWGYISVSEYATAYPFATGDAIGATLRNILLVAVCVAAIVGFPSRNSAISDTKLIIIMGLILWLVSSLYLPFAPDFLKAPLLLPLAPVRALALPQNLAYVLIAAGLLHRLRTDAGAKNILVASVAFGVLVLIGPGNHLVWLGLILASFAVVVGLNYTARRTFVVDEPARFLAQAVGLVFLVSFAVVAWQKGTAWRTLINTGVHGASLSAHWIGVAEYIRANTPPTASVLPLYWPDDSRSALKASRTLGSRTGRAMPVPTHYGKLLDPDFWEFVAGQRRILKQVLAAFDNRDLPSAEAGIQKLVPVADYIVIPTDALGKLIQPGFPFVKETEIRGNTILRRTGS